MSVSGKFSTMSMADLIQWARTAQRTGQLKLTDGAGKEIQVLFADGRIIFSSTNDKRERWRAYLLYLGLCSEEDIEAAFRVQTASGTAAASVLVGEKKITTEEALATLTEKTMEDVCDVFLWTVGTFEFQPSKTSRKSTLTIDVDPIHVVWEGLRRVDVWNRMNAYIHPHSCYESADDPFPESDKWEDPRVARHVFAKIDGTLNVSQIVDGLPFSRYKIYRSISELLSAKMISPTEITAIVDREKRIHRKRDDARLAADTGRWTESMDILHGLISANPGRAELVSQLMEVTSGFERSIYEHNFTKEDVPVVAIGSDALSRLNIYPSEAFLLSRVDGRLSIGAILKITPMNEIDALRAFKHLLSAKVIDFPFRQMARPGAIPVPTR